MARLAFDTGGTFTDFALIDDRGDLHLHKVLSTPLDPAEAVIRGIDDLLELHGETAPLSELQILGATTVVTNAILERKGVPTSFVTTAGFEDLLRIRTEGRYDLYDLDIRYPAPLVPRARIHGVRERIAADGTVMAPLDEAGVREIAARLRADGTKSVAVCLLHAYKFPQHEARIAAILGEELPGVAVSISSNVCPEVREYDRASTTVANAYTQPIMAGHTGNLEAEFARRGVDNQLLWMTSSGGVVPGTRAAELPVRLIESGPAAGAVAAAEFGRLAGETSLLSFDMGGTTAKLCIIPDGEPKVGTDLEVARHQRFQRGSGFPLKIQSIQMIEIGAGGGSIAARTPLGLLDVGPRSAGALPGPAAYGRGGTEPTVTDADIFMGYMGIESFVGGTFKVSRELAVAAVGRLAGDLGITPERAAWGIHDLINDSMSKAAAMHASDLGLDPRRLPMVAFGGAGPVHAYGVARKLGVSKVVYPTGAGVTSAIGLLIAPVAVDLAVSSPMSLARWDGAAVRALLDRLARQGAEVVISGGVDPATIVNRYTVDMRHIGQGHEITVTLPDASLPDEDFVAELRAAFLREYRTLYGRVVQGSEIEVITWRLRAAGEKGAISGTGAAGDGAGALKGRRPAYFPDAGGFVETPVYDHYRLAPGEVVEGPAIIEQRESTVVFGADARAHKDARGNLVLLID